MRPGWIDAQRRGLRPWRGRVCLVGRKPGGPPASQAAHRFGVKGLAISNTYSSRDEIGDQRGGRDSDVHHGENGEKTFTGQPYFYN